MTKPQIWVAAFLVLFILLFLLQRVTKQEDTASNVSSNTVPQSNMTSENISGEELIGRLGCMTCHGADLNGSVRGPGLNNLKEFWTRDPLISYLRNPNSFMNSERFNEYKKKYPNVMMPSFNNIDVKNLGQIADYLLAR